MNRIINRKAQNGPPKEAYVPEPYEHLTELAEAAKRLPEPGQRRKWPLSTDQTPRAAMGTVVSVHGKHLWYAVRFESGVTECYRWK